MAPLVGGFEAADEVGAILAELVELEIETGGLRDEQPALVVEAGHHRMLDQRRPGDAFDDEAWGDVWQRCCADSAREE